MNEPWRFSVFIITQPSAFLLSFDLSHTNTPYPLIIYIYLRLSLSMQAFSGNAITYQLNCLQKCTLCEILGGRCFHIIGIECQTTNIVAIDTI